MYYIYALYNKNNDKIYIGQTNNLSRRLDQHNLKLKQGYTANIEGEWSLIYSESVATRSEAIKREKQLKTFRGREFVRAQISSPG